MQRILRSVLPALVAATAGLGFLAADGNAKTLTRGTPAQWKAACEANPRACKTSRADGEMAVYNVCFRGRCYVVSCTEAGDGGACERADAPGQRPRPKQVQWSAADLL